jgi:hypothetical protein
LIASLPSNLVYIFIFFFVDLGFLTVAASYFAAADGKESASIALKKTGGAFCFIAGLIGWQVVPLSSRANKLTLLGTLHFTCF